MYASEARKLTDKSIERQKRNWFKAVLNGIRVDANSGNNHYVALYLYPEHEEILKNPPYNYEITEQSQNKNCTLRVIRW